MTRITVLLLSLLFTGCAAWIDHSAGRFKHTFHSGATQSSIRGDIGLPEYTYTFGVSEEPPKYQIREFHFYDVFDVTGKIHKPGDGSTQATISAITLGIGELILIPATVAHIAVDYTKFHTLVVFYNDSGEYLTHHLYDSKGMQESSQGY